jgi:hypothetical protein
MFNMSKYEASKAYLTDEQFELIMEVNTNHMDEYNAWSEKNISEILKVFNEGFDLTKGIVQNGHQIAYLLADKFMKERREVQTEAK